MSFKLRNALLTRFQVLATFAQISNHALKLFFSVCNFILQITYRCLVLCLCAFKLGDLLLKFSDLLLGGFKLLDASSDILLGYSCFLLELGECFLILYLRSLELDHLLFKLGHLLLS